LPSTSHHTHLAWLISGYRKLMVILGEYPCFSRTQSLF
jgi:hypothetical protein